MERDHMVHRRRHQGVLREHRSPHPDEHSSRKHPRQSLSAIDRRSPEGGILRRLDIHPSLSGSPQGGIASPILSNIYLDKLDKFVEKTLIPEYTKSDKRETNPAYGHVANQLQTARRQGNLERVRALQKALRKHPSKTQDDPGYRRLRYIRYAENGIKLVHICVIGQ